MGIYDCDGTGEYVCTVTDVEVSDAKTGTPRVDFWLRSDAGRKIRARFFITDAAIGRLASFCRSCGLTDAEGKAYDPIARPKDVAMHRTLVGRRIKVFMGIPDGKDYPEIVSHKPVKSERVQAAAIPAPVVSESTRVPTGDEIPF